MTGTAKKAAAKKAPVAKTDSQVKADKSAPTKKAAQKRAPAKKATTVKKGRKLVKREFTIVQHTDPRRHEPGGQGIYLDDVMRERAETQRAKLEGRKPDYDNPGSHAGDVVTPTHVAAATLNPGSVVEPDYELEVAETDNS